MISSLKLKFGSGPGKAPVDMTVAPVTVFVGPNNSGKSKILQELYRYCISGTPHHSDVILESVIFQRFQEVEVAGIVEEHKLPVRPNENVGDGSIIVGRHNRRHNVYEPNFLACLNDPNGHAENYCRWYLSLYTLMLDGKNRINLVNEYKDSISSSILSLLEKQFDCQIKHLCILVSLCGKRMNRRTDEQELRILK